MPRAEMERRVIRVLVYGRVRDAVTGEPVSGARVSLGRRLGQETEQVLAEGVSDAEGVYFLRSFAGYASSFAYDVGVVAGRPYRRTVSEGLWCQMFTMALGETAFNQTIWLAPAARLGGRVLTAMGDGAPGATVEVADPADGAVLTTLSAAAHGIFSLTDDEDLFGFGSFSPGSVPSRSLRLRARQDETKPYGAPVTVTVSPGATATVNVSL